MSTEISSAVKQIRLQEWARQIRDCQSRPQIAVKWRPVSPVKNFHGSSAAKIAVHSFLKISATSFCCIFSRKSTLRSKWLQKGSFQQESIQIRVAEKSIIYPGGDFCSRNNQKSSLRRKRSPLKE